MTTFYSPPNTYYSQVNSTLDNNDMYQFIGRDGAHFKYLTDILCVEYIWWNKERNYIEIWGPHLKLENAKKVIEEKLIKYINKQENLMSFEIPALDKKLMEIAVRDFQDLKKEWNLHKIWWNKSLEIIQVSVQKDNALEAKTKINNFLNNIKQYNPHIKTYEDKYVNVYIYTYKKVVVEKRYDSYLRRVEYDIVGTEKECRDHYLRIIKEYPENPYFTKIVSITDDVDDKVVMKVTRSNTSD